MVPPPEAARDHASKVFHLFCKQDKPHRNVASSLGKSNAIDVFLGMDHLLIRTWETSPFHKHCPGLGGYV